jgi:hypothetical protein
VRTVADHDAGDGTGEKFRVVGMDEGIGTTADFVEVGKRGNAFEPGLVGGSTIERGGGR